MQDGRGGLARLDHDSFDVRVELKLLFNRIDLDRFSPFHFDFDRIKAERLTEMVREAEARRARLRDKLAELGELETGR